MVKSSTVLVGGSGFIGTRLASRLLSRERSGVVIVDKAPSRSFPDHHIYADVTDAISLARAIPADALLVNLAAEHRDDVSPASKYWNVNVEGARNLCEVARDKHVNKLVFTSTVAIYGFAPVGTREDGQTNPFNEYGRSKLAAEAIYRDWQAERPHQRSLVILRPTVVFGERNRGNVYNLLRQVASNRFVMVGGGTNRKSIAYVENVVAAIEHCMEFGPGIYVYNYVDKPDFTMNELVAEVRRMLGRRAVGRYSSAILVRIFHRRIAGYSGPLERA